MINVENETGAAMRHLDETEYKSWKYDIALKLQSDKQLEQIRKLEELQQNLNVQLVYFD